MVMRRRQFGAWGDFGRGGAVGEVGLGVLVNGLEGREGVGGAGTNTSCPQSRVWYGDFGRCILSAGRLGGRRGGWGQGGIKGGGVSPGRTGGRRGVGRTPFFGVGVGCWIDG